MVCGLGKPGSVEDVELVASGDAFVGQTVNEITSSRVWASGHNAIVITFDEGNFATQRIPTIVITNKGPRGVKDKTEYNHYSLLASLQQAFGLGCLQNSCTATPMTPLFEENLRQPATPASNADHRVTRQAHRGQASLWCRYLAHPRPEQPR